MRESRGAPRRTRRVVPSSRACVAYLKAPLPREYLLVESRHDGRGNNLRGALRRRRRARRDARTCSRGGECRAGVTNILFVIGAKRAAVVWPARKRKNRRRIRRTPRGVSAPFGVCPRDIAKTPGARGVSPREGFGVRPRSSPAAHPRSVADDPGGPRVRPAYHSNSSARVSNVDGSSEGCVSPSRGAGSSGGSSRVARVPRASRAPVASAAPRARLLVARRARAARITRTREVRGDARSRPEHLGNPAVRTLSDGDAEGEDARALVAFEPR